MACPNYGEPVLAPIGVYIIARLASAEPIVVEYYRGWPAGWSEYFQSARMFLTTEDAQRVRDVLGSGAVYELMDGEGGFRIVL